MSKVFFFKRGLFFHRGHFFKTCFIIFLFFQGFFVKSFFSMIFPTCFFKVSFWMNFFKFIHVFFFFLESSYFPEELCLSVFFTKRFFFFFLIRVVMDPRTTELIYGTRKTKGTEKVNETLAGSEFFSSNRCDPQSIFRWATLKRVTRIFQVMYIREFKNSYLSFQCASDHLSSYRYWSFHLRAVQDSHHFNRFFFCRGYDLSVRVRRARLTSDADFIRMCHCHCHCQGLFLPKRLFVVSQKKIAFARRWVCFSVQGFFFFQTR